MKKAEAKKIIDQIPDEFTTNELLRIYLAMEEKERFVHPELKEGEVFLINATQKELENGWWGKEPDFIESLRIGNIAYTTGGTETVPEMKPLFGKLKTKTNTKKWKY